MKKKLKLKLVLTEMAPAKVARLIDKIENGERRVKLSEVERNLGKYLLKKEQLANLNDDELNRAYEIKKIVEDKVGKFSVDELWQLFSKVPQLLEPCAKDIAGNLPMQYNLLKERVLNQDEPLKQLCLSLHEYERYWNAIDAGRATMKPFGSPLIIGESGTGKTYMIEQACKLFGCKLIKIDGSRLTPEGYIGLNFGKQVWDAVNKDEMVSDERVVVFIDEFDKLSSLYNNGGGDYKGDTVLNEMLPFLDNSAKEVRVLVDNGSSDRKVHRLDISKICFIFAGAFTRLRLDKEKGNIGFFSSGKQTVVEYKEIAKLYPREISGRLGKFVMLNGVNRDFLEGVLVSKHYGLLRYYRELFREHGQDLYLTDEEKEQILAGALEQGAGARGLSAILQRFCEQKMMDFCF